MLPAGMWNNVVLRDVWSSESSGLPAPERGGMACCTVCARVCVQRRRKDRGRGLQKGIFGPKGHFFGLKGYFVMKRHFFDWKGTFWSEGALLSTERSLLSTERALLLTEMAILDGRARHARCGSWDSARVGLGTDYVNGPRWKIYCKMKLIKVGVSHIMNTASC